LAGLAEGFAHGAVDAALQTHPVRLVTRDEIKSALRIDGDDENTMLDALSEVASEGIIAYLKAGAEEFIEGGEVASGAVVPARVRLATIYWVGVLRRNPDNDTEGAFQLGYPPLPVVSMLCQMRDPALA